jgi:hypothetical protein
MQIFSKPGRFAARVWFLLMLACVCAGPVAAQSTDIAWPTPVRANEVSGSIPARDLGDPRITDHFYAFTSTPGDVLITVDSRNLNGDIDVFTLSGLRPLLKFTVYAGSSESSTRSIFLRTQEELLLRVEGRTPNDDPATYHITFAGAFAAITSGPLVEHEDALAPALSAATSGKGGRRVSSVGARIEQPPSEVAETPAPEPTPAATTATEPAKPTARISPRNSRVRRPPARRTRPTAPPAAEERAAKVETADKPAESTAPAEVVPPVKSPKRTSRRNTVARKPANPPPAAEPEVGGPHLVIETNDGTLVDRYMNSVRRVTVENGQVVVLGKDGKVQRIPLATVVRMTIAP